jgi:hypothetical protein
LVPPHLTLIVYNTFDINDAKGKLDLVGDKYPSFDLNLSVLEVGLKERRDFPKDLHFFSFQRSLWIDPIKYNFPEYLALDNI